MCGIAGYFGFNKPTEERVIKTLSLMDNRGPDSKGYLCRDNNSINVTLLHSRLSIIDLDSRANQPFNIGDYYLIFNGEIYNYLEIRSDLQKCGINFLTESDTEVLLQAFIQYGESCLDKFEGMWSFAIYNALENTIFLSRDRFAEKPLYYFQTSAGIYFGSEIKFLKSLAQNRLSINTNHILRYMVNGYKSLYKNTDLFYNEVKELPYASYVKVDSSLEFEIKRYWQPKFNPTKMSINDAIEGFKQNFHNSIKLRLRSDVPVAFCLSGGVDSSALVSVAVKKYGYDAHTFSIIESDERYNEFENIKATLDDLGCKNTLIHISQMDSFDTLRELIAYHDSPISTISYLIHSFISQKIREHGYKVVFSGTAADELLTGYYDHFNLYLYEMRDNLNYSKYLSEWQDGMGRFVRNEYLRDPELFIKNRNERRHIYLNNDEFRSFLKVPFFEDFSEENFSKCLLRNRMLNELFHEVIPVVLKEDDLNSMMNSIENRSPYLDTQLFEFCYSIPNEYLIQKGFSKYILRESTKGILNEKVRLDKQKKGFNASVNSLFDFTNKNIREYLLANGPVFEFIDRNKIESIINKEFLTNSYSKFLFNFINIKIFLDNDNQINKQ